MHVPQDSMWREIFKSFGFLGGQSDFNVRWRAITTRQKNADANMIRQAKWPIEEFSQ